MPYTALRAQSGPGTVAYNSPVDSKVNGSFTWQATDPHGDGDDGGIVISASGGGFWVRDFTHAANTPIDVTFAAVPDPAPPPER